MKYLSKDIEALAKSKRHRGESLIKKEKSCGIFQDYDTGIPSKAVKNKS